MQTSLFRLLLSIYVLCSFSYGYSFTSQVDKTSFMVGEKAVWTLKFCYDNVEEYTLEEPKLQDFKVTLLLDEEQKENNLTTCALQEYELRAQKAGTHTLPVLKAHIESIPLAYQNRYNKNHYLEKSDIYTKPITIDISALPQGVQVTGTYALLASIDKTEVQAQKPLHLTIKLKGEGNLENIDFLTLNIPHTLIYAHPTQTLSKTFDIIADVNYTIPAISLTYFNQTQQMVELLSTDMYPITVIKASSNRPDNRWILLCILSIYFVLFFYAYYLFEKIAFVDEKQILLRRIQKAKNKTKLLNVIAPYMLESRGLKRVVLQLEKSESSAFKRLKKEIIMQMHLL